MKIGAIIVAAGRGTRAGGEIPKQYREIGGRPVLARTLDAFLSHPAIGPVIAVIGDQDGERFEELASLLPGPVETVTGGATRTASVRAGLQALEHHAPDAVMIHDAARPFISAALIGRIAEALAVHGAVIPVTPGVDAMIRRDSEGRMIAAVDRAEYAGAQTPQAFHYAPLMQAYRALGETALPDDAAVAMAAGQPVQTLPGEAGNFKLTTPDDFDRAEAMLNPNTAITVTGQGFDVHRLEAADSMMLCGIEIRDGLGLVGHSDADVGLHALTDAILGAAGQGDIGQHFNPSDARWKGAASHQFVSHAVELLRQAGGTLLHADITLIGERPKIGPHRDAMRQRVAQLLGLQARRVNIKATTTERLGFTGRGEGLAAQAIVSARMI
ncbi:bifunctional 2-C-methyl-D-erythritol 4-phosphate cytidylyltransferase/2-C-methyl-D-erythritol 2,4-cyclodiphosphate synthase [Maricaulis salignorans]|uniref:bifunctional 2-C-methyl-D-erythritol 4-phosphate cytidylyltransferase/2-C-methyl-D-erythritol 2,4-cyclodiphosphate synthase n=1 Tax=Maricaulis salignorans TaxID=144026 RepID=UPI003A8E68CE